MLIIKRFLVKNTNFIYCLPSVKKMCRLHEASGILITALHKKQQTFGTHWSRISVNYCRIPFIVTQSLEILPRLSGRRYHTIDKNTTFYHHFTTTVLENCLDRAHDSLTKIHKAFKTFGT